MNWLSLADSGRRAKLIILAIAVGLLTGLGVRVLAPSDAAPTATHKPAPRPAAAAPPLSHPLTIEAQRGRKYGGGGIKVEEELAGGKGYKLRRVSFASDGHKVYALAAYPEQPAPSRGYPVVIALHGYVPPSEYETTEGDYIDYAKKLAADGYVVFRPDLRGFGDSWGTAEGAYFSSSYTTDVLNLRHNLRSYPGVDPSRVGLFGYSMGARVALNAAVVAPKEFDALVLVSGSVGRPETMHQVWRANSDAANPVTAGTRSRIIELFGEPRADSEFWQKVSPYGYLKELEFPIQIHHAMDDPLVPVEFSQELAEALDKSGRPSDNHFYPYGTHGFAEPLRSEVYERVRGHFAKALARR